MALRRVGHWRKLPVSLAELSIDTTLRCGQSFRWRKINDEWICTLHGRILSLQQDATHLHYRVTWPDKQALPTPAPSVSRTTDEEDDGDQDDDTESLLRHYFSLDLNLSKLYEDWSQNDPNFRRKAPGFAGVRILSQDAWEALIGFICSSNNNISRISQMVHKLCVHYGPLIGHVGDDAFHDFPTPESLTGKEVETHLRELGFGYRAKYIADTARIVALAKPASWLESLRNPERPGFGTRHIAPEEHKTYKEAHEKLLTLSGVGPKVADCVCLMGLGWGESVPVDTHVWQIAQRDYKFGKSKVKTLNKVMYDAVGDHFRELWGKYAGWAHSVLFAADLREFSSQIAKKEDDETVQIKEEFVKEEPEEEEKTPRKKRALVRTELREKIHVEDTKDGTIVKIERSAKKRRTRIK